jgi:hypothetical protein
MEDFRYILFFWRSVIAYLALFSVELILLGIALGRWDNTKKPREQETLN